MNLINDTWRGLVRRKLWPVALLLVGALIAVPFTLAKEPDVAPAPANAVAAKEEGLPATYVTAAADEEVDEETDGKRRRTLGDSKDPFEPAPLPKAKKKKSSTKKSASASSDTKSGDESPSSDDGSNGAGGGTVAPVDPVPTATPTATATPAPANSVRVRFSRTEDASEDAESTVFERLEVLPDTDHPVLVYRGLKNHGKVAIFELTGTVTVEGDASCEPTPEDCQQLTLRAGETAFITVADTGEDTDGQYQLDLVKINK